jgi:hypothetical protein
MPRKSGLETSICTVGHRHAATTRVYIDSIPKKKDKHNRYTLEALDLPELEEAEPFHDHLQNKAT